MLVLVISDIHGRKRLLKEVLQKEEVDYVIISGDITHFGTLKEAEEILRQIVDTITGKVLFVPGNCDPPQLLTYKPSSERIVNLHGISHSLNELRFIGIGGGLVSPFNTLIELTEEEYSTIIDSAVKSIKDYEKVIVLSHTPPYNTKLDIVRSGLHVGSKSLRKFIEERKPLLCICGHIHESRGIDRIGNTLMVNPGPLAWGYYAIVELYGKVKIHLKNIK